MKRLKVNHLGKKHLDQYSKITVKSLFKEIENQVKKEILKLRLNWIEIVYTKANYGWYRKWFKCPLCSRKVFTLYNIMWKLKCRKCSGLHYKSQNLEKNMFKDE